MTRSLSTFVFQKNVAHIGADAVAGHDDGRFDFGADGRRRRVRNDDDGEDEARQLHQLHTRRGLYGDGVRSAVLNGVASVRTWTSTRAEWHNSTRDWRYGETDASV